MRAINLFVDLTDAPRRLLHAQADIPVQAGTTVKLTTPLWLCESHVPNGPIGAIAGLVFTVPDHDGCSVLPWRRDPLKPYVYWIDVPEQVSAVHVRFDAVIRRDVTRRMITLVWESVLLHPAHVSVDKIPVRPSICFPADWHYSTPLSVDTTENITHNDASTKTVHFEPVTVERLQDSPILVGSYLSETSITPDGRHLLCVAGNKPEHTVIPARTIEKFQRLVKETHWVFGNAPYSNYRFLVLASNIFIPDPPGSGGGGGIEHAECSHLITSEDLLISQTRLDLDGDIFSHEFNHAWNGKYRRPAGHVPKELTSPLDGTLLWVYEGLTQYYGYVLSARSGIMSPKVFLSKLASTVADMGRQSGRLWRSIEDTATGVSLGKGIGQAKPSTWASWLRGSDYYHEGVLFWLDADTIIRRESSGRKSLDDFCRQFFGHGTDPKLSVVPYTLNQLQASLNDVVPYGWDDIFTKRIKSVDRDVNIRGIRRAGYDFRCSHEPSSLQKTPAVQRDAIWYSVGLRLDPNGTILDVARYSHADFSKLAPAQKILHIEDGEFSIDAMTKQIEKARQTQTPIEITLEQDHETWVAQIEYYGGLLYPRLERRVGNEDMLLTIITSNTSE